MDPNNKITTALEALQTEIAKKSWKKDEVLNKLSAVKREVDAAQPYQVLLRCISDASIPPSADDVKKILQAFKLYRMQLVRTPLDGMYNALKEAASPDWPLTILLPIFALVLFLGQISLLIWKWLDSSTELILVLFGLLAILHLVFVHRLFRVSMPLAQVKRYGYRNNEEKKLMDRCSRAEQYKPIMQWFLNISMVLTVVAVIPKAAVYEAYLSGKAPRKNPVINAWAGQIEHILTLDSLILEATHDALQAGKQDSLLVTTINKEVRKALRGRQSEAKAIYLVGGASADTTTAWGADLLLSTNNTYRVGRAMLQGPLSQSGFEPRMVVVHAGDPFHATIGLRAPIGAVAIYVQWP